MYNTFTYKNIASCEDESTPCGLGNKPSSIEVNLFMEWKVIPCATNYEVSETGEIRSLITSRIIKQGTEPTGYKSVTLRHNGKYVRKRVHQFVAISFIPNPDNLPVINHIDGNKGNNHVSNLEWCTQMHNIHHAFRTGLIPVKKGEEAYCYGEKNKHSRKILNILTGEIYNTVVEAAEKNGIPRTSLSSALNGRMANAFNLDYLEEPSGMNSFTAVSGKMFKGYLVLNLESGIYYGNISEAARAHGMPPSTLNSRLRGISPNPTNLRIA